MSKTSIKAALRCIDYCVFVLGVEHAGESLAATVTWVTQASFEPRLLVVGVKKSGRPMGLLRESRQFALSFLESGQGEIARTFFKTASVTEGSLAGYGIETRHTRAPILVDAMGWLEAKVLSIDETGDHVIVVAEVESGGVRREGVPLTLREMGLKYGG